MVGKTVRVTRPSRSRHLSVNVSIRCEMLPSARRSSLNRFGPSPSVLTTSTVHLSPTRASTSLTARQSSGTCRLLGISDVPSCRRLGIYLALVSNRNQGRAVMAKVKVAVVVGSNRRDSINRKLARALAELADGRFGTLGALVMGGEAYISFKPGPLDSNGTIADETTRGFLKAFVDQFAALVTRPSFAREAAV